jgi:hypothetical protein
MYFIVPNKGSSVIDFLRKEFLAGAGFIKQYLLYPFHYPFCLYKKN